MEESPGAGDSPAPSPPRLPPTIDEALSLLPEELQAEYGRLALKQNWLSHQIGGHPLVQELQRTQTRLHAIEAEAQRILAHRREIHG